MTRDELIAKSGEAYEFQYKLRVVPLDYALQALDGLDDSDERILQMETEYPEVGALFRHLNNRISILDVAVRAMQTAPTKGARP